MGRAPPKSIITPYTRRMLIENGLANAVSFFHLDALSWAIALNVDFDVLLNVIASGLYRQLAKSLRGYERAQARQIFRRFLDSTARVTIAARDKRVTVTLPAERTTDAGIFGPVTNIPWWHGWTLQLATR